MIHIYKNRKSVASFDNLTTSGAVTRLQLLDKLGRQFATEKGCAVTLIDSETRLTFESVFTAKDGKVSSSRLYKITEEECNALLNLR